MNTLNKLINVGLIITVIIFSLWFTFGLIDASIQDNDVDRYNALCNDFIINESLYKSCETKSNLIGITPLVQYKLNSIKTLSQFIDEDKRWFNVDSIEAVYFSL